MATIPGMNLDFGKLTWAGWVVLLGTAGVFVGGMLIVGSTMQALGIPLPDSRPAKITVFIPLLILAGGFFWGCQRLFEACGVTVYRQ